MPVKDITTLSPGLVGVYPRLIYISTNNTLAEVTTTGYLNIWNKLNPGQLIDGDMALVITKTSPSAVNVDSGFLQVNYASGSWSLIQTNSPGTVVLPTIANHIATYTNTTGGLSEDPTTAISGGNIQAGLSGTAGYFASFPLTASTGSLRFQATSNSGNTVTTITNASFGQATTLTIPDPGVASATFVLSDGGTQHITSGNFQVDQGNLIAGSSGNAGTVISYPSTSANGTLILAATNAGGAFNTTISNGTMGQTAVITIPDPGASTANFILNKNATVQQITSGNLQVTAGSLISGISTGGFVGKVQLFPTTASTGSLTWQAVANSGNTATIFQTASLGQATTYTVPDPAGAAGAIAVAADALVNGNLIQASGTAGLISNSGIATAQVMQLNAVNTLTGSGQIILVKANGTEAANAVTASGNAGVITTSSLTTAGGGTYVITWTNTNITATSVLTFAIQGGTNTVQNITFTCVPGAGTATLTIYNNTAATQLNGTILIGYTVL